MASRFHTIKWAIPAGFATVLAWFMSMLRSPFDADFITNPDALVRLERIRQLMDGGGWFEPALMRVSSAQGIVLHWSRPLDVLTTIAAWPLSLFMEVQEAVLIGAMGLALVMYVLTVFAVFWVLNRGFKAPAWAAGLGALSFLTLTDMMAIFAAPSWPDHHGLMVFLFVLSTGLALRMIKDHALGVMFGVVQGIAVWVSPESLVVLAGLSVGLVLVWIKDGDRAISRQGFRSAIGLGVTILLALGIEYKMAWPGFALDRLSGFSLLVAFVVFVFWGGLSYLPKLFLRSPLRRMACALVLAGLCLGFVVVLVPHSLAGPMAAADPWFMQSWSAMFGDSFRQSVWDGWVMMVAAIVVLLGLRHYENLALLAPMLVLSFTLSALDSTRWVIYGETLAIMVLVLGFAHLWPRLRDMGDGLGGILARACSLTAFIVFPIAMSFMTVSTETQGSPVGANSLQSLAQDCKVQSLLPVLQGQPKTRVLAHPNVAPAILYFTQHDVVAVPIHPNAQAVHDSVRILMAKDDAVAFDLVKRYGIGLIVLCPTGYEAKAYGVEPDGLYARTLKGHGPAWLKPIEVGTSVFRVFAVQN